MDQRIKSFLLSPFILNKLEKDEKTFFFRSLLNSILKVLCVCLSVSGYMHTSKVVLEGLNGTSGSLGMALQVVVSHLASMASNKISSFVRALQALNF